MNCVKKCTKYYQTIWFVQTVIRVAVTQDTTEDKLAIEVANMNISEKKEAVRQVIVSHVPDIMKLQFGCEVKSPVTRAIKKRYFTGSNSEQ